MFLEFRRDVGLEMYVEQIYTNVMDIQNGVNITRDKAKELGWTPIKRYSKNRYLIFIPSSKQEKKNLIKMCKYDIVNKSWCFICGKEMNKSDGKICKSCLSKGLENQHIEKVEMPKYIEPKNDKLDLFF